VGNGSSPLRIIASANVVPVFPLMPGKENIRSSTESYELVELLMCEKRADQHAGCESGKEGRKGFP
jgi:hypothetical protein